MLAGGLLKSFALWEIVAMAIFATDQRIPPDPRSIFDVYCDESSQTRHRYMIMGGIILQQIQVEAANARIAEVRLPELPQGEMKWGSVSTGKYAAYQRVVDAFFDDPVFAAADFHSSVVDTWNQDHVGFNEGNREVTFNKELYQLATKFARLYPDRLFHLYPDNRDTSQLPGRLREILNWGRRKKGDRRDFPYRRCHFRKSHETPILQVVDVLLGGLAYRVNGHHTAAGASPSKVRLSSHILNRAGVADPMVDTAMGGKFTIWYRQLQPRRGRPPGLDRLG